MPADQVAAMLSLYREHCRGRAGGQAAARRVHDYPDGTLAVFHEPRCLARYHGDGRLTDDDHLLAACDTRWAPRGP